jgi:hypothetical protein
MTLSITALSIQHNESQHRELICDTPYRRQYAQKNCHYAECQYAVSHYAECRYAGFHCEIKTAIAFNAVSRGNEYTTTLMNISNKLECLS